MASLQDVWQKDYSDMPFDQFAERYRQKFYPDMDAQTFAQKTGIAKAAPAQAAPAQAAAPAGPDVDNAPNELGVPVFNKAQSAEQIDAMKPKHKGLILPWTRNQDGTGGHFDMTAGIPGAILEGLGIGGGLAKQAMDGGSQALLNDPSVPGRAMTAAATLAPTTNPAIRAGDMVVPGAANALRKATPKDIVPPTAAMLKKEGGRQFDALRDLNVDYNPQAVASHAGTIQAELQQRGFGPRTAEKTNGILNDLQAVPSEPSVANIRDLHAARKNLSAIAQGADATDAAAASAAIKRLDDFLRQPGPQGVVAGPASKVSPLLDQANGNYAAGSRSNTLAGIEGSAELRAAAANSGQNLGNTLRGKAASLADPQYPERMSGFNSTERAAIEAVARGSATRNTLRYVANLLGGGGGLGQGFAASVGGSLGMAVGGLPGAVVGAGVPAVVGAAAKAGERALTRKSFTAADELVRQRSPLFQKMLEDHPGVAPGSKEWRMLAGQALLAEQAEKRAKGDRTRR